MENQNNNQKILIVEDEIIIAMDLKSKLQNFGYTITDIVTESNDAISSAEKNLPDLVLMDIRIKKGMDGIDTALLMKKKFNIPIIYLTAFIDDETVERARLTAPDGYLIKPVQDKELEITVKMSLHKNSLEKKLKKNQLLLDTILGNVEEGIISVDNEFRVIFSNLSANNLLKIDGNDIIGRNIDDLFLIIDELEDDETYLPSEIIINKPFDSIHLLDRFFIERTDKSRVPIQINYSVTHSDKNIPQGYIFVLHDNTERRENVLKRKQLLQELKAKKNELEQIISFASHDLRTPLINIIGFSRELIDTLKLLVAKLNFLKKNDEDAFHQIDQIGNDLQECTHFIQDSGQKLSLMFSGLLELSISEKREPLFEEINVNELMETIIDDLSFRMSQKDIIIKKENFKNIFGDRLLLSQVFGNLLDNVIKFSKPNTENVIKVSQSEDEEYHIFCIEDKGIGIQDNFKDRVFGYFEADANNKFKGYGLGLTIVKKIIEKHHGNIWFESVTNKGSKFSFTIPKEYKY